MDFFGILFDMKNGKKIPYSKNYFDTLFAENLAGVTTLTGTLPLTFTTSETALRSWTIYGNNTPHNYSAEGTLPLTFTTHTAGAASDWSISGNDENGTENLFDGNFEQGLYRTNDGTPLDSPRYIRSDKQIISSGVTYTFSFNCPKVGTAGSGKDVWVSFWAADNHYIGYQQETQYTEHTTFITPVNAAYVALFVGAGSNGVMAPTDISDVMLVKGSTAPDHYIPYQQGVGEQRVDGYYVPLTISQAGQPDKNYDIFIGSAPLTEGETVSKTSTGVDIELFEGENTVSTTLYNKPETSITYADYLGVGEYVNGQWQIPLTVTCNRNLFNIYGNMAHTGGVHTIDFNVETSSVTAEMTADTYFILGFANAIVKGDETFVISFDKTTAGTAELRMMNGTGSSAEVIETFDISAIKSYQVVFECEESFGNVYPRLVATEAATQTFEHLMIKKASDKGGFVPYGAHTDYTIPIDAPLTEGQSVSDTVEITAYEGENTIDTTLYNKPTMTITYK